MFQCVGGLVGHPSCPPAHPTPCGQSLVPELLRQHRAPSRILPTVPLFWDRRPGRTQEPTLWAGPWDLRDQKMFLPLTSPPLQCRVSRNLSDPSPKHLQQVLLQEILFLQDMLIEAFSVVGSLLVHVLVVFCHYRKLNNFPLNWNKKSANCFWTSRVPDTV